MLLFFLLKFYLLDAWIFKAPYTNIYLLIDYLHTLSKSYCPRIFAILSYGYYLSLCKCFYFFEVI